MLTLTFQTEVGKAISATNHKKMLKSALTRARRLGASGYVWVREYNSSEGLHWHLFLAGKPFSGDPVDWGQTFAWSEYWAKSAGRFCSGLDKQLFDMAKASARAEVLFSAASGRYAAKEGAKRFQKIAPDGFSGIAWWRASRNMECKPVGVDFVPEAELQCAKVEFRPGSGDFKDIPYKFQFAGSEAVTRAQADRLRRRIEL